MLITNATLITWEEPNRILENHAVYIEGDRIQEVGPTEVLLSQHPDTECLDAGGQYVMPGNICAHTHFYGAFARGLAIPEPAPKDLLEILQKLWWPLDKSLTPEDTRASALVMAVDAIKHGTTTLIDHHASPNAIEGSLDVIEAVMEQAGLRAVLCYEVSDRDGPERTKAGILENTRFIQKQRATASTSVAGKMPRIAATFGLHASLTLSDATLSACREAVPDDVGFHIHAAEGFIDQDDSLAKSGLRVVERLYQNGILGPRTIVAHAVHIVAREIATLAESGCWVTHQPRSNMNNGVGVAEVESQLRAGVPVCMGTDGFSHTMWQEWQTAYLLHKVWQRDPRRMSAIDVIRMGVYNNAALANLFFPQTPLGVIAPGAAADIIFADYHPFTPITTANLPWHIIFGFQDSMITTTLVAGQVLMRDHRLLTLDEEAISAQARQLAPGVWARYQDWAAK
jgi:putative selenium metabolism protein SsnA